MHDHCQAFPFLPILCGVSSLQDSRVNKFKAQAMHKLIFPSRLIQDLILPGLGPGVRFDVAVGAIYTIDFAV